MSKIYIGCKLIEAKPMTLDSFNARYGREINPATKETEGYEVTYPDGYVSWSPKSVFENAYRELTHQELCMIHGV